MIYIASPYSHPNPEIRQVRFEQVCVYVRQLMAKGVVCFSPIAYGHQFSLRGAPTDYKSWADFNDTILIACSEMHILMCYGWEASKGIQYEIRRANDLGLPITHIELTGVPRAQISNC